MPGAGGEELRQFGAIRYDVFDGDVYVAQVRWSSRSSGLFGRESRYRQPECLAIRIVLKDGRHLTVVIPAPNRDGERTVVIDVASAASRPARS